MSRMNFASSKFGKKDQTDDKTIFQSLLFILKNRIESLLHFLFKQIGSNAHGSVRTTIYYSIKKRVLTRLGMVSKWTHRWQGN
jgi:hypothetical protein